MTIQNTNLKECWAVQEMSGMELIYFLTEQAANNFYQACEDKIYSALNNGDMGVAVTAENDVGQYLHVNPVFLPIMRHYPAGSLSEPIPGIPFGSLVLQRPKRSVV
jgi:hypothetical protein